jgi:hypothetical protein
MKRYHEERHIAVSRARLWKEVTGSSRPAGYFRKKKPFDCGHSQCFVCGGERKYPKRTPTKQEVLCLAE